jgi:hypothetical protein
VISARQQSGSFAGGGSEKGDNMIDMSKNVDVYVCAPDSGISRSLESVFIQFQVMDPGTMTATGKLHTVGMTTLDAMWLLKHLEYIQNRFDIPKPDGPIEDTTPSAKGKN